MSRRITLRVYGAVTDATECKLLLARWQCLHPDDPYNGMWIDPRTGNQFTISQAAAILAYRQEPRFDFR